MAGDDDRSALFELFTRLWEIAQGLTPALVILVLLGLWHLGAATHADGAPDQRARKVETRASILLLAVFASGVGFVVFACLMPILEATKGIAE